MKSGFFGNIIIEITWSIIISYLYVVTDVFNCGLVCRKLLQVVIAFVNQHYKFKVQNYYAYYASRRLIINNLLAASEQLQHLYENTTYIEFDATNLEEAKLVLLQLLPKINNLCASIYFIKLCIKNITEFKGLTNLSIIGFNKTFINFDGPPALIDLKVFGYCFLDWLPESLQHLQVSYYHCSAENSQNFDNLSADLLTLKIRETYATTISHLDFTNSFNRSIDYLPANLKRLDIESNELYSYKLDYLPEKLKYLSLKFLGMSSINHLLENLEYLNLFCAVTLNVVPVNLKKLIINIADVYDDLDNVVHLQTYHIEELDYDNFSDNLVKLKIFTNYDIPLNYLPVSLKKLVIYGDYNGPLDWLPAGLLILKIINNSIFAQALDGLPTGLKKLEINMLKNYQYELNYLPESLILLYIMPYEYDYIWYLPGHLKILKIVSHLRADTLLSKNCSVFIK